MKKGCFILLFFVFVYLPSYGQKLFIYGDFGFGSDFREYLSAKIGLNAIYNKYCFAIDYCHYERDVDNLPADYQNGYSLGLPSQSLNMVCFTAGRVITINRCIDILLKGGPCIGQFRYASHFTPISPPSPSNPNYVTTYYGPNYDISYGRNTAIGVLLNPTIEFPFSRVIGLSAGLFCNINTQASTYGVEGNILLGKLRKRKKGYKA